MSWQTSAAANNAAQLRAFGVFVTYQQGTGDPFALPAVRLNRDQLEANAAGAFEGIWTRTGLFSIPPAAGDTVLIDSTVYVVHNTSADKDPLSDGVSIYLNKRRP